MQLTRENITAIPASPELQLPTAAMLSLPEKVLQFGTGVLLRALPDYFIDNANRKAMFNGRIVVVKSTPGDTDAFDKQDNLYTICVRGIEGDKKVEDTIINSSISRVLSASSEWDTVLSCARNSEIQVIISNTTEVGIVLSDDKITDAPPASFPGKLLAYLYERFKTFNGSPESGMVIIPTELITDNGKVLREILEKMAAANGLEDSFLAWLTHCNHFCSSLVDRIVPGSLVAADRKAAEEKFGYTDDLIIMAERFSLWAIESDSDRVRDILSFAPADTGVVIAPDIEKFRELKLRLLNGTHTFSCGLALLAGFTTVKQAMQNESFSGYLRRLTMLEIANALGHASISYNEACAFANTVMDRFRNPYLEHKWTSIAINFTAKMKLRNVPLLTRFFTEKKSVPVHMALGFAAYLLFFKNQADTANPIQDDHAQWINGLWATNDIHSISQAVLSATNVWGEDLTRITGLVGKVTSCLLLLNEKGPLEAMEQNQLKKSAA